MKKLIFIIIFLLTVVVLTRAQNGNVKQPGNPDIQGATSKPDNSVTSSGLDTSRLTSKIAISNSGGSSVPFKVIDVYKESNHSIKEAGINDDIIVKVDSLELMINRTTEETGQIILFINHLPLKGVYGNANTVDNEMRFKLSRNEKANETWNILLNKPSFNAIRKPVLISIGYENKQEIPTVSKDKNFTFVIVKTFTVGFSIVVVLLFLFILIWLGKNTEMLREPLSIDQKGKKRPYSLALTQMAFWYFLVVSAIIFLFLITKEFPDINTSILILIGISSLTALSSTAINSNKIKESKDKYISLKAEKKTLAHRIEEIIKILESETSLAPDKKIELQKEKMESEKKLNEVIETIPRYSVENTIYFSKSFFKDLVSDCTGVSLHRFQIAVWTLVLSVIFIYSVWSTLKMPAFNDTLLALMGISSGTYIGFKIPEQKIQ